MIGRLLRRLLGSDEPRQLATVVLAPGETDPAPALFLLDAGRILPAASDAALEALDGLGHRFDLAAPQ